MTFTEELKAEARHLGFQLVGACPAVTPAGIHRFLAWLDRGYDGQMTYLRKRAAAYEHPQHVLPGARSLLMLGMRYRTDEPLPTHETTGRISRYAWGSADYHDVIHGRLKSLKAWYLTQVPAAAVRGVVDSAPLLEREFAQLAGLGWIGKHTLLIHPAEGSWFFLAALLTDQSLDYDEPFESDHCGRCRACLDICPTDAFPAPYVLDARRCISYLTIEHRDPIDESLREAMGSWVFGCDLCQEVCPWNRKSPQSSEGAFEPRQDLRPLHLLDLFTLDDDAYRQMFRRTPLWRVRRRGLLRNAAIALGNQGTEQAVPSLKQGLTDSDPMVRAACVWALQRIATPAAGEALKHQANVERDPTVREALSRYVV